MKKKIIFDLGFNILASVIPIFGLQFIILPLIAKNLDADSYGELLTLIAFINLSATTFGSVLNNSKLIQYNSYREKKIEGDYNVLLLIFIFINIFVSIAGILYYKVDFDMRSMLILIISSTLLLYNTYSSVEFRINLQFRKILLSSLVMFFGYLVGYFTYGITGEWSLIYLIGFGFNSMYLLCNTRIIRESYSKTVLFNSTLRGVVLLLIAGILASSGAYIDRLLIFPLLGGVSVSIYYVSTILGKTISMAIGPMTGVLLSYLTHMKKFSKSNFNLLFFSSIITGIISYVGVILISRPFLSILYPAYVIEAMRYVPITTASTILVIISSAINPILLKFHDIKWQIVINSTYIVVYIFLSIKLSTVSGLMGFCLGLLYASMFKLIVTLIVYFYSERKLSNLGVENVND